MVDVLRSEPTSVSETCYFRLHGLGPGQVNYKDNYSAHDLRRLLGVTFRFLDRRIEEIFVMFNNMIMLDNARAFQKMCSTRKT